jgi:3-phosphoglycerate kinase
VGSDGNFGDQVMFTAPTGYRPVGGNGWQVQSIRSSQGTAWFGYISTGGTATLAYGLPGLTLAATHGVVVRARYLSD